MSRRRKAAGHSEHEVDERWLITYADMITLLMVFFIVLYAASTVDVKKFQILMQQVSAAFNVDVLQGESATNIGEFSDSSNIPNFVPSSAAGAASIDFRNIQANLMDYAVANGLEASVDVEQIDGGVLIRIGGTLLFPSGRAELTAQSHELLGKIVELARPLVNEVRVEGHTDDLAPSNSPYSDNWQLSSARAVSVLQVLLAGGISADRLSATGYADARPLEPNNSPAARARNRRVEILLIYPEADSPFASPEDH